MGKTFVVCQGCGEFKEDVKKRRQSTAYVEDERNWATLCWDCHLENEAYWRERWDDYYEMVGAY